MIIHASSDLELKQLAELLLSKYNIDKENKCKCCSEGNGHSGAITNLDAEPPIKLKTSFDGKTTVIYLDTTPVVPGVYPFPIVTVDKWGRITNITSNDIDQVSQDAVGSILTDTPTIDFTYDSINSLITADVIVGSVNDTVPEVLVWDGTNILRRTVASLYTAEQAQDDVFDALFAFNAITGAYDDDHEKFTLKWGGRLTENTVIFSNLNDFYDVTITNIGSFNVDGQNINLFSTATPTNFLNINANSATLETDSGHIKIANNDVELKSFTGVVRVNSPLYLDNLANTSSIKVLAQDITGIVVYRTISQLIADYGGVGVTSVGASITGTAINISGTPITTTGTLAFSWTGNNTQMVLGDGTLATLPAVVTQYTDEQVRNVMGVALTTSSSILFTPNDGANTITATLIDSYARGLFSGTSGVIYTPSTGDIHIDPSYTGFIWNQSSVQQPSSSIWVSGNIITGSGFPSSGSYNQMYNSGFLIKDSSPQVQLWSTDSAHFYETGIILKTALTASDSTPFWRIGPSDAISTEGGNTTQPAFGVSVQRTGNTYNVLRIDSTTRELKLYNLIGSGSAFVEVTSNGILRRGNITDTVQNTVRAFRVKMRVDDDTAPSAASTTFNLKDPSGNSVINKVVHFHRERQLQFSDDDYTYNILTGDITVTVALETGERLEFWIYPPELWTTSTTSPSTPGNRLMVSTTDAFLINSTDRLLNG
jgi:hypothetical protein